MKLLDRLKSYRNLVATPEQFEKWTLPSKASYVGAVLAIAALTLPLISNSLLFIWRQYAQTEQFSFAGYTGELPPEDGVDLPRALSGAVPYLNLFFGRQRFEQIELNFSILSIDTPVAISGQHEIFSRNRSDPDSGFFSRQDFNHGGGQTYLEPVFVSSDFDFIWSCTTFHLSEGVYAVRLNNARIDNRFTGYQTPLRPVENKLVNNENYCSDFLGFSDAPPAQTVPGISSVDRSIFDRIDFPGRINVGIPVRNSDTVYETGVDISRMLPDWTSTYLSRVFFIVNEELSYEITSVDERFGGLGFLIELPADEIFSVHLCYIFEFDDYVAELYQGFTLAAPAEGLSSNAVTMQLRSEFNSIYDAMRIYMYSAADETACPRNFEPRDIRLAPQ